MSWGWSPTLSVSPACHPSFPQGDHSPPPRSELWWSPSPSSQPEPPGEQVHLQGWPRSPGRSLPGVCRGACRPPLRERAGAPKAGCPHGTARAEVVAHGRCAVCGALIRYGVCCAHAPVRNANQKTELQGPGSRRAGEPGCFPLRTPRFHTSVENGDQGLRGGVTETELGVLALQARPGCPPRPADTPAAAGAQAGHADLAPGDCHRLASLCPAESTCASQALLRPPCS